jgi:two-component system phosphate regulon sensor histidine kinase PhoR
LIAVDTSAYLMDLGARLAGTAEGKRVRIDVPEGLPAVKADPARLERVMMNLLTNALKYSPSDTEVVVAVSRGDGSVVVSVSDKGPGIPSDELLHLFERVYRTRATREREEGLGLGLYISRMLVEAQGGRIWAESEVGKGSTFFFSLPAA